MDEKRKRTKRRRELNASRGKKKKHEARYNKRNCVIWKRKRRRVSRRERKKRD